MDFAIQNLYYVYFCIGIIATELNPIFMSNLVFNPQSKDFFQAKACVAIPKRYNYSGSKRSYRFDFLSFTYWSLSYRAAFCYVLTKLEYASICSSPEFLPIYVLCFLFEKGSYYTDFYDFLVEYFESHFRYYTCSYSPAQKLSFVYKLLECLTRYNLGEVRYDLVSSLFDEKSAIRYAASKYFPDIPFVEIESDFIFRHVMD